MLLCMQMNQSVSQAVKTFLKLLSNKKSTARYTEVRVQIKIAERRKIFLAYYVEMSEDL